MVDVAAPLLRAAAGAGALLRHRRRALHPVGLVLDGVLEVDPAVPPILDTGPLSRSARLPVVARLSKAVGTPGALPDVLGLALRVDVAGGGDLLFASAGLDVGLRHLFLPATDWLLPTYGCVLPYDTGSRLVLVAVRPVPDRPVPASDDALRDAVAEAPIRAVVLAATLTGPWRRLGRLRLTGPGRSDAERPLAYEPVSGAVEGLRPALGQRWFRRPAYAGSQVVRRNDPSG